MTTLLNIAIVEPDETVSTLVPCNDDGAILLDYFPVSGEPVVTEYRTPLRSGSVVTNVTLPPVKETVRLLLTAADDTTITTFWRSLERAFLQAAERQRTQRGAKVYVVYQVDRLPLAFRSEITSGRIITTAQQFAAGWRQRKLEIAFSITRQEDWESTVLTALPLTSKATAKTTAGVIVRNHWDNDAGDGNWVQIDAADLPGVTATPIRLEVKNLASGSAPSELWVARSPATLTPLTTPLVIEAENPLSGAFFGGTTVTNATYSNSAAVTVNVPNALGGPLLTWDLSASFLTTLGGAPFRLVGRFPQTNTSIWMFLKVTLFGLTVLAQTPTIRQNSQYLQDFGVINLPPWAVPYGGSQALRLELIAYSATATTCMLDCIQLMPADDFTVYQSRGYGLQTNVVLIDDALNHTLVAGGAGIFVKKPRDGFTLTPQRDQRLYFLQQGVTTITRELEVKAFFRERRLSL